MPKKRNQKLKRTQVLDIVELLDQSTPEARPLPGLFNCMSQ